MSGRRLALLWAAALLLAAAVLAGIAPLAMPAQGAAIPPVPVVAIGSSATRNAMPARSDGMMSLLGDGRAHVRFGLGNITEAEALRILRAAIAGGADTILLEIHPFAFDFSGRVGVGAPPPPGTAWAAAAIDWSHRLFEGLEAFRKNKSFPSRTADEPDLDAGFALDPDALQRSYPLHLRFAQYGEEFRSLIDQARARHVAVVLVALPRAASVAPLLGAAGAEGLQAHLRSVADDIGLPLFATDTLWPDALFVDQGHLNRAGRARFVGELQDWWRRRHGA